MTKRIVSIGFAVLLLMNCLAIVAQASSLRETPLVRAVKRIKKSVVNIHSEKTAKLSDSVFSTNRSRKVNGMGTGIIIDESGYIVTNYHVIHEVDLLKVTLADGGTFEAQVVSYDRKRDLAIIKINSNKPLPVMPIGTSSDLMLGETVIAIGNAFGYEHTVTSGIVSSLSRDVEVNETQSYENLIQTDASINPGNSGGPLLNLDGEVVGINVAIRAGAQRIGFAIPIDDARVTIRNLLDIEQLKNTQHGVIGQDVKTAQTKKLIIKEISPQSPAEQAGLKSGDQIIKVEQTHVQDSADLERILLRHKTGETVPLVVRRENNELTLSLKLDKYNQNSVAAHTNRTTDTIVARNVSLKQTAERNNDEHDQSWNLLGLRLGAISSAQKRYLQPRYRGGLKVLAVRPDSPAARNGIREGDVLVGLHQWETISAENISYILNHNELKSFSPLKFYIVRGYETLYGHLKIATP